MKPLLALAALLIAAALMTVATLFYAFHRRDDIYADGYNAGVDSERKQRGIQPFDPRTAATGLA